MDNKIRIGIEIKKRKTFEKVEVDKKIKSIFKEVGELIKDNAIAEGDTEEKVKEMIVVAYKTGLNDAQKLVKMMNEDLDLLLDNEEYNGKYELTTLDLPKPIL